MVEIAGSKTARSSLLGYAFESMCNYLAQSLIFLDFKSDLSRDAHFPTADQGEQRLRLQE